MMKYIVKIIESLLVIWINSIILWKISIETNVVWIQFEFNQFILNWVELDPIQPISMGTITILNPKKKSIMFIWLDFNLEIWIESKLNLIWN
jgi:hypothetical protein